MAKEIIDDRCSHVEDGKCDICGEEIPKGEVCQCFFMEKSPDDDCYGDDCYGDDDDESFEDCDEPYEMSDIEADCDTLANAGFGTDEDYGYFGTDGY